jgi:hypothetical protein
MIVTPKGILIDSREFNALPEYSCSLPTGQAIGKKWRRRVPYQTRSEPPNDWYLGEYVESLIPGQIGIEWTKLILPDIPRAPTSTDPRPTVEPKQS